MEQYPKGAYSKHQKENNVSYIKDFWNGIKTGDFLTPTYFIKRIATLKAFDTFKKWELLLVGTKLKETW